MVEPAACGQTLGQSADRHRGRAGGAMSEHVAEVMGGGLALDVRADGEDDFAHGTGGEATFELADPEVFRMDVIEWRQPSTEHVVEPVVGAGAFEGDDVGWLFDHADDGLVAFWRLAERSRGGRALEKSANLAMDDPLGGGFQGSGQLHGDAGFSGEQGDGHAFGAAGADSLQSFQMQDKALNFCVATLVDI